MMRESNPASFLDVVTSIVLQFENKGFEYAISGAMANVVWGIPRTTRDVDILISVISLQIPNMLQILSDRGCNVDTQKSIDELRSNYFTSVEHKLGDVEVFIPAVPYHKSLLQRRVKKQIDGKTMWFVSPEDLIILKMIFHRGKDILDIKGIVSVQGTSLDKDYIMQTFKSVVSKNDPRHKELKNLLQV